MEQIVALADDGQDRLVRLKAAFRSAPGDLSWIGYGDDPWLLTLVLLRHLQACSYGGVVRRIVPAGALLLQCLRTMRFRLAKVSLTLKCCGRPCLRFRVDTGVLYGAVLILTIGATLLAAYLLLRDVNREVQMAMRSHFVASVSHR